MPKEISGIAVQGKLMLSDKKKKKANAPFQEQTE